MASKRDLVDRIYAYAMANYENGWDFIVECYPDEDVLELLDDDTTTFDAAIAELQSLVDLHEEQAANCGAYDEY